MTKKNHELFPFNDKEEKIILEKFLKEFKTQDKNNQSRNFKNLKYLSKIEKIKNQEINQLEVQLEDIEEFLETQGPKGQQIFQNITNNTRRYQKIFYELANSFDFIKRTKPLSEEEEFEESLKKQRMENMFKNLTEHQQNHQSEQEQNQQKIINLFKNNFQVIISSGENAKQRNTPLRDLKSNKIGQIIKVKGIVSKTSEVSPMFDIVSYICESCLNEILVKVTSDFNPPQLCESQQCRANKNRGIIIPNYAMSKFQSFQKILIEELRIETPVGNIPRKYELYVTGSQVRSCSPGDLIEVTGIFLSHKPRRNKRNIFQDQLIQETYIMASKIQKMKENYDQLLDEENSNLIKKAKKEKNQLQKLIDSLAPEIFGMNNVKKALLLQMVEGSTIETEGGVKIRGNLNIGLIGDPGIAKSQFLKLIAHISPRGVYTTGKGASGAGLTATIAVDLQTQEKTLEGGALVMADKGICCIDEFDKMDEQDRVSIHEVMEQQTISIAKSGITTRLNARASILCAANPVYGRYNRFKSPHENVNLPYSLLSRFDLMFILLDNPDQQFDQYLAKHITYQHTDSIGMEVEKDIYNLEQLKVLIAHARTFNPYIPDKLHSELINYYTDMRQKNKNQEHSLEYSYITPRTLLSLIRLSQAHAKLRFSEVVSIDDIREAIQLTESARSQLQDEKTKNLTQKVKKTEGNSNTQIYKLLVKFVKGKTQNIKDAENYIISKGFSK